MPIYFERDIPDFDEEASLQRTVPLVESGVEKEEEEEKHLQQVINEAHEAIVRGSEKKLIIPTREAKNIGIIDKYYKKNFILPKTLIRFSLTVEECTNPEYCMDEHDTEYFLKLKQAQPSLSKFSELDFEIVMQTFEEEINQNQPFLSMDTSQILPLSELITSFELKDVLYLKPLASQVYPYWRERRISKGGLPIMAKAQVGDDKDDDDPYVCFRRREIRQARKTRRSDAQSYDRLRRLRQSMETSLQLLEQVYKREQKKLQALEDDYAIFQKRCLVKKLKRTLNIKDSDELLINPKRRPIEVKPAAPVPTPAPPVKTSPHPASYRPQPTRNVEVRPLLMLDDVQSAQITQFQIRLQQRLTKKEQLDRNWVDLLETPSTVIHTNYPDSFYRNIIPYYSGKETKQSHNQLSIPSSTPSTPLSDNGPTYSTPHSSLSNFNTCDSLSFSSNNSLYGYSTLLHPRNPICVRQRIGRGGRLMLDRTRALPVHRLSKPKSRVEDRWLFDIPFDADDTIILDDESDASIMFRASLLNDDMGTQS